MDFDIVSFPVWEDYEGIGPEANSDGVRLSSYTEHKEEVFRVLAYMTGKGYRLPFVYELPVATHLNLPNISDIYVRDNPEFREKYNVGAVVFNAPAMGPSRVSRYEAGFNLNINNFLYSDYDVNEFLRIEHERAQEHVRSRMEQQ